MPLTVFVQDKGYLANPPLSPVQYEAVLHAERIYYPAAYEVLAASADGKIREYWSQPVRMVNFLELEWGKGGGKDHTCRMIAMRVCYLLLCLRSPQDYYGMPAQDSIHCLNVASSSKQAQRAFFAPMRRAVTRPGCWFQRVGVDVLDVTERRSGRDTRTTALLDTIRFEHNIEAVSGHSDADSQEGLNLMLGIADEVDAFKSRAELAKSTGAKQRESSSSAESILEMLRTSAATRFPETYKNVHISYPRYLGSVIQQQVRRGKDDIAEKGEASRYYVSGPLSSWDANPRIPGKQAFAEDYAKDPAMAEAKYECKPQAGHQPVLLQRAGAAGLLLRGRPVPGRRRLHPRGRYLEAGLRLQPGLLPGQGGPVRHARRPGGHRRPGRGDAGARQALAGPRGDRHPRGRHRDGGA